MNVPGKFPRQRSLQTAAIWIVGIPPPKKTSYIFHLSDSPTISSKKKSASQTSLRKSKRLLHKHEYDVAHSPSGGSAQRAPRNTQCGGVGAWEYSHCLQDWISQWQDRSSAGAWVEDRHDIGSPRRLAYLRNQCSKGGYRNLRGREHRPSRGHHSLRSL